MLSVTIAESTLPRLAHSLTRLEILARSVHVAFNLKIHQAIGDLPISIDDLYNELQKRQNESVNLNHLFRLLKFLASYGIFNVQGVFVSHSVLSQQFFRDVVVKNVNGKSDTNWEEQTDFIAYLSQRDDVQELYNCFAGVDFALNYSANTLQISAARPEHLLLALANLQILSRAVYTVTKFKILDFSSDGPVTVINVAKQLDMEAVAIERLFALLNIFSLGTVKGKDFHFAKILSPLKMSGNCSSWAPAVMMSDETWWKAIGRLEYAVRTGKSAYFIANGINFFEQLESNPSARVIFDEGLANFDADATEAIANNLMRRLELATTVVDLGGGNGHLLTRIVDKVPTLAEAFLVEKNQTITELEKRLRTLSAGSLSPYEVHLRKCALVRGDLLSETEGNSGIPEGKDIYIIKGVLHDFSDRDVLSILRNVARAMSNNSELKVIERRDPDDDPLTRIRITDMQMMLFFASRERTYSDYKALGKCAGLTFFEPSPTFVDDYAIMTAQKSSTIKA